jgi:hypothetical protein
MDMYLSAINQEEGWVEQKGFMEGMGWIATAQDAYTGAKYVFDNIGAIDQFHVDHTGHSLSEHADFADFFMGME